MRQGERTVVDAFTEQLTAASRAAEALVSALDDTQIVTGDFGTSLLKVGPLIVVLPSFDDDPASMHCRSVQRDSWLAHIRF